MKYPMATNYLTFKRKSKYLYEVYNALTEERFTIGCILYDFLSSLDGKTNPYVQHPFLSCQEIDDAMHFFKGNGLIRTNRILHRTAGTIYLSTWLFPKHSSNFIQSFSKIYNGILLYFWLPIFLIGLYFSCNSIINSISHTDHLSAYWIIGTILGLVLATVVHEGSHALAAKAYGAYVFECGIIISCFCPGAYVLIDSNNIDSIYKRIQILLAGIESNFLISGIILILSHFFPSLAPIFVSAAIVNIFLAVTNLLFFKGSDGASIMNCLLGITKINPILFIKQSKPGFGKTKLTIMFNSILMNSIYVFTDILTTLLGVAGAIEYYIS